MTAHLGPETGGTHRESCSRADHFVGNFLRRCRWEPLPREVWASEDRVLTVSCAHV